MLSKQLAQDQGRDGVPCLEIGEVVDDDLVVQAELGRGGEGAVYRALDRRLGRPVALKLLGSADGGAPSRFGPGQQLAALRHPHVVGVYRAGAHRGAAYLALELVEGPTLAARLAEGVVAPAVAFELAAQLAAGLDAAHRLGLCHGDLKPANVLLSATGAKLIDFAHPRRGTPAYLAPERREGQAASPAADCWALGVIVVEALSGRRVACAADARVALEATRDTRADFAASLLIGALDDDATKRPSAEALARGFDQLARGDTEPYVGLRPLGRDDTARLIGRQGAVARALAQLRGDGVLAIAGPSGSGKSSLIRAGVLPALEGRARRVIELQPSPNPWDALAAALLSVDPRRPEAGAALTDLSGLLASQPQLLPLLLAQIDDEGERSAEASGRQEDAATVLVLDGLERWPADAERARLVVGLCAAARAEPRRLAVIIALRDGALTRLAAVDQLRAALSPLQLLGPPGPAALGELLARPLEASGYRFEDDALREAMVDAVVDERCSVAMLQLAASELWARRDVLGRQLTWEAYRDVGGVAGALARHAEALLASLLDPADKQRLRALLCALTDADGPRAATPRDELLAALGARAEGTDRADEADERQETSAFEALTERAIEARLVVSFGDAEGSGAQLALAHPELLTRWPRLAGWHAAERDRATLRGEVEAAAELWRRRGERDEDLWHGNALREVEVLLGPLAAEASSVQRFIAGCQAGARAQRRRRARGVALALAAGALLGLALGWWLRTPVVPTAPAGPGPRRFGDVEIAAIEAALAQGRRAEARARLLAISQRAPRPLAAVRGLWFRARSPLIDSTHEASPSSQPSSPYAVKAHGAGLRALAHGRRIAVYRSESGGGPIASLPSSVLVAPQAVVALASSGDRGHLAAATRGGQVLVWRLREHVLLDVTRAPFVAARLRWVGDALDLVATDGRRVRWRPLASASTPIDRGHRGAVSALARWDDAIVSGGDDRTLRRWSTSAQQLSLVPDVGRAHAIVAAGRTLLVLGHGGRRVVALGAQTSRSIPLPHPLQQIAASPRGSAGWQLLGIDRRGRLWRLGNDNPSTSLDVDATRGRWSAIAAGPAGRFAVGSSGGELVILRADGASWSRGARLRQRGPAVLALAWQGQTLASLDSRGRVSTWRKGRRSGRWSLPWTGLGARSRLAWSGARLLAASGRRLAVVDPTRGVTRTVRRSSSIRALVGLGDTAVLGTGRGTVEVVALDRQAPASGVASHVAAGQGRLAAGLTLRDGRLADRGRSLPAVGIGVSAAARGLGGIVVGYADGRVALLIDGGRQLAREGLPPSGVAATRLLVLPAGSLLVGHGDGTVALWQTRWGHQPGVQPPRRPRLLRRIKLHGTIVRMGRRGSKLSVTTDLGDEATLDLGPLLVSNAALRAEMRRLPLRWSGRVIWPNAPER
jgi:hypothetical protein